MYLQTQVRDQLQSILWLFIKYVRSPVFQKHCFYVEKLQGKCVLFTQETKVHCFVWDENGGDVICCFEKIWMTPLNNNSMVNVTSYSTYGHGYTMELYWLFTCTETVVNVEDKDRRWREGKYIFDSVNRGGWAELLRGK